MMFLVGLTGGIATGKSTVSKLLQGYGCVVIDADLIAREVVEPGKPALRKIRDEFGADVINEDGTLNREKLGSIIFNCESKRRALNKITHPEINKVIFRRTIWSFFTGKQFVVLDIPLLFETGNKLKFLSYTVVVSCPLETQLERLMARNNYSESEALQRIQSQMSLEEKCRRATHIIDNSHSIAETEHQVKQLLQELKCSKKHWPIRIAILTALSVITLAVAVPLVLT